MATKKEENFHKKENEIYGSKRWSWRNHLKLSIAREEQMKKGGQALYSQEDSTQIILENYQKSPKTIISIPI